MSKILFDPENMSIDEMTKEIHLLRNSRDLALELVFSYPEAKAAEKIVLNDEEISLLKAKLPSTIFNGCQETVRL
ncbi:hypothetical protein NQB69_24660 (plasmid) [Escherichia coli]|nr:hypothetical protein NQB69_24660 [Escherichia coli]